MFVFLKWHLGQVGITLNADWMEPVEELSPEDWYASDRAMQFSLGWFASPIFGSGDYPQVMRDNIRNKTDMAEPSRLPEFTEMEIMDNQGLLVITSGHGRLWLSPNIKKRPHMFLVSDLFTVT